MLTSIAMIVLALAAAFAVFGPYFDDSLPQRISLSGICITALAVAWWAWRHDVPAAVEWFAIFQAAFTVASILKRPR